MKKRKSLREVETCAFTLQSMLQAEEKDMNMLFKFSWIYPQGRLYDIAKEAIAGNTRSTPVPLFVWLVKEKLGYESKGQRHGG